MKQDSYRVRCGIVLLIGAVGFAIAMQVVAQEAPDLPRLANGHPDLNGTWDNGSGIDFIRPQHDGASICISGCEPPPTPTAGAPARQGPDRPVYRPEFQAKVEDLDTRQVQEDPVLRCASPGLPRIGPPDKIVQGSGEIIFLYDDVSGNFFRIVPIDGRLHRSDAEPSYLGDAIGHWDGDTLVVETVNFNGESWLTDDGSFHTADLRVVERLRRDGETLQWRTTAFDPAVLAEPWELRPRTAHLSQQDLVEAPPCIDYDLPHMLDGSSHDNPR